MGACLLLLRPVVGDTVGRRCTDGHQNDRQDERCNPHRDRCAAVSAKFQVYRASEQLQPAANDMNCLKIKMVLISKATPSVEYVIIGRQSCPRTRVVHFCYTLLVFFAQKSRALECGIYFNIRASIEAYAARRMLHEQSARKRVSVSA